VTRRAVRHAAAALTLAPLLTLAGVGLPLTGASAGQAAGHPPRLATVTGDAGRGGAVILLLRDQFQTPTLDALNNARQAAVSSSQAPVLAQLHSLGATSVLSLVSVNAIASHVSAADVQALRSNPAVVRIGPDVHVPILGAPPAVASSTVSAGSVSTARTGAKVSPKICPTDPKKPFLEPEALSVLHAQVSGKNPDESSHVATGKGVIVAIDGMNELAGNPNFIRPNGKHVVIDAPNPNEDDSDGEYYGDASSVAAQGTVVYDYSKELPYSGLPKGCTFVLRGVAPDASLVDTTEVALTRSQLRLPYKTESAIIAGIDYDVLSVHADILSESYGYEQVPGQYAMFYGANDAAVRAGVTVVVSSGDSGVSGTMSSPSTDPLVIEAGATNTLRLEAQGYGYDGWTDNNITPLSSGGTAPNNRLPDLVAPGYSGEAACSQQGSDCPSQTQTEAFGGTSESCPLIAGAAADVIQAYADAHGGTKPTPAVVKELLVSGAQDIDSPSDQQGGGLLDIYAATRAAQRFHDGTGKPSDSASLVASPSQLVVAGTGTAKTSVKLFNTSGSAATVTGEYRSLGALKQIGKTVTEKVTAPKSGAKLPVDGAKAAAPIHFTVPTGLDRLTADMIWPDASNANVLSYTLVDPKGRLTQISYDYGNGGSVPDIQHVEVADPTPGTWTALIKWANGRGHLQELPNTPGSYRGDLSFRVMGAHFVTSKASGPVVIPAGSSKTVPLTVALPKAPGDHPESVQFVGGKGQSLSLAVARRTLIPSQGGSFDTLITSSVGRGVGQISTFDIDVPAGKKSLDVHFTVPDTSADNELSYFLIDPSGDVVDQVSTPSGDAADVAGKAVLSATKPVKGRWEIDVMLDLTTSGREFTQTIPGTVSYGG
jgi:hypothetical protein